MDGASANAPAVNAIAITAIVVADDANDADGQSVPVDLVQFIVAVRGGMACNIAYHFPCAAGGAAAADWLALLTHAGHRVGARYGPCTVSITSAAPISPDSGGGQELVFEVAGRGAGTSAVAVPLEECRAAIEHVADRAAALRAFRGAVAAGASALFWPGPQKARCSRWAAACRAPMPRRWWAWQPRPWPSRGARARRPRP